MGAWRMRRPLLVAGVIAFAASLFTLYVSIPVSLVLAGFLFMIGLCLYHWPNAVFCLLCACLFLVSGGVYRWRQVDPQTAAVGKSDTVTGQVLRSSGRWHTLRVIDATHLPIGGTMLLYANDLAAPTVGETVQAAVTVEALSAQQQYWRSEGIFVCAYPNGYDENALQILEKAATSNWLSRCQQRLTAAIDSRLPLQEGAVLTAICFGQRQGLSEEVQDAFRTSGLIHLLVVSGLHLTMVSGCVLGLLLLCRLPRRWAVAATMAVTVIFALFIGLTPSVVRATVMCLALLGGWLLRRPANGLNSMGLALGLLLLYNPYMALNAGLQLSFAATVGVLVAPPRLYRLLTACCSQRPQGGWALAVGVWKGVAAALAGCVGALLVLTPLQAFLFGSTSLWAPLSNLLAVIPAGWCLVLGWLAALLLSVPLGPLVWLGEGLLFLAAMPTRFLLWVADAFSRSGQLYLPDGWRWVIVCALCGGVLLWLFRPVYVRRRAVAMLLAMTVAAGGWCAVADGGATRLWVQQQEGTVTVILQQDDRRTMLVTDAEGLYTARRLPETVGVTRLDAVAVGNVEPVHEGNIAVIQRLYGASVLDMDSLPPEFDYADGSWQIYADGDTLSLQTGDGVTLMLPDGTLALQEGVCCRLRKFHGCWRVY